MRTDPSQWWCPLGGSAPVHPQCVAVSFALTHPHVLCRAIYLFGSSQGHGLYIATKSGRRFFFRFFMCDGVEWEPGKNKQQNVPKIKNKIKKKIRNVCKRCLFMYKIDGNLAIQTMLQMCATVAFSFMKLMEASRSGQ